MFRTDIEEEIAKIIELPRNEFTFYEEADTKNFALYIHYKHFDDWISMYQKEVILLQLALFIIQKYNIKRPHLKFRESNYITVNLKGEDTALQLYKYDYTNRIGQETSTTSCCNWRWFEKSFHFSIRTFKNIQDRDKW